MDDAFPLLDRQEIRALEEVGSGGASRQGSTSTDRETPSTTSILSSQALWRSLYPPTGRTG
jgi:hypothetical protein